MNYIATVLIVWAHKKENLRGIWDSTEVFCLICCVCWATQRASFRTADRLLNFRTIGTDPGVRFTSRRDGSLRQAYRRPYRP